jgi:hypothetical protein
MDPGIYSSHLDKRAVNIVGWMTLLTGAMILTGEYLCVEVAWRCMDYNPGYVGLAVGLAITGLTMILTGARHDKTDLTPRREGLENQ